MGKELRGLKVATFMTKDPIAVPPDLTVREFIDKHLYRSHHFLYPVTEKGKLLGYISLREVKAMTPEEWKKISVEKAMLPLSEVRTISPDTTAMQALNLVQEENLPALLVVKDKHLVGLVTAQDLFKLISLKLELESQTRV
jgi:CBS domain-containing protein